jgi:type IV secretory pathway VirB2 component (pilin)
MIGAGYLTAAIASMAPIAHSVSLGAVMVVLGLVWMFVFWGWMPLWYQVVLVSIALPAAATGGMLRSSSGDAPTP